MAENERGFHHPRQDQIHSAEQTPPGGIFPLPKSSGKIPPTRAPALISGSSGKHRVLQSVAIARPSDVAPIQGLELRS